ncbi:hypothetical protein C0Q70_05655 [Pomacea canaliculata]|uniref:Cyclin N-terminal domain-containing protein n=1 Tax=Pomacea canaliculata TaxID=400727 RepID=A0A2T7PLS6_POMCA|nr:hypothetical protein C0Q70_05655 [Pomacea canaliculata]
MSRYCGASAGWVGKMFPSGLNGEHVLQALGIALRKEEEQWKPVFPRTGCGEIRPKYLQCVAISCLYIAAKTLEDDEAIPITLDLVQKSQCGCSVSEVLRMELVILNTLKWNVKIVTAIDFLHLIHTVLMWRFPHLLSGLENMSPSRHLALLTRKLMTCLGHATLACERPSIVALSLISLELEQICQHWFSLFIMVQTVTKLQVENNQFISCRERMAWVLSQHGQLVSGYQLKSITTMKSKKRKVDYSESDNIYDGIKRLYEDNGSSAEKCSLTKRGSCASEMHQEMDEVHPFIHTVAAV